MDILRQSLFPDDGGHTYAIIDGASCQELLPQLDELRPKHFCLYAGELAPDIQEVAPYLIELSADHAFTAWLLAEGFGKHWGIFARTRADLRATRKHFRTFLMVKSPEGESLYFRYYDPRVFRIYLPTCNAREIRLVGGPIHSYFMEGEQPKTLLRFSLDRGKLETLGLAGNPATSFADPIPDEPKSGQSAVASATLSTNAAVMPVRITNSQVTAFSAVERENFDQRMIAHLKKFFPKDAKNMSEPEMRRFIADGLNRAARYEIKSERNVCLYIDVMLMLGRDFEADTKYLWARTLLRSKISPDEKMTSLYHTAAAHAGERNSFA